LLTCYNFIIIGHDIESGGCGREKFCEEIQNTYPYLKYYKSPTEIIY